MTPADEESQELGGMVAALASGIARGQRALDAACVDNATRSAELSLQALGVAPTFYQFAETTFDVKLALQWRPEPDGARSLRATPVGARYTSGYGFALGAAATLRFEVVPVPPPAGLVPRPPPGGAR